MALPRTDHRVPNRSGGGPGAPVVTADPPSPVRGAAGRSVLDRVRTWVEMVGVVAAVVGIAFLLVQTRELQQQNQVIAETLEQTYRQDTFDKTLGFDEFVVEHAYRYAMVTAVPGEAAAAELGRSLADPASGAAKRAEADAVAVHVLDFYDYILLGYPPDRFPVIGVVDEEVRTRHPAESEGFLAWSGAIRDTFRAGSYLCRTFDDRRASFGAYTFVARIDRAGVCAV